MDKLSVRYYGKDQKELGVARLYLTAVGKLNPKLNLQELKTKYFFPVQVLEMKYVCLAEISLDVDADRDGVVEKNNPKKVR